MSATDQYPPTRQVAVGIIVDESSQHLLNKTVKSISALSEHIYVLAIGNNLKIKEPLANVIEGGWANDDAASKNYLIDEIEKKRIADYLIWMNPGDRFDEKTIEEFKPFVQNDIQPETIYMMVVHRLVREDGVRDDFDEETIDARLMPLNKGVRFEGRVRASLLARNIALMTKISAAPGRFILPSRRDDPLLSKKKAEKTLRLIDVIENEGEVIADELLAVRAEALSSLENYAAARRVYQQLLKSTERTDLKLSAYYGIWATFFKSPIPNDEITKLLIEAMELFPVDTQLLTFLGSHLQHTGKGDLAIRTFETALQHGRITLDVWHRLRIKEIAITSLALSYRLQNRNSDAIKLLEENLPQIEDRSEFNRHLLDLYIAESQETKGCEFAAEIWGDELLDQMRLVIKGACAAKMGAWNEALPPLEDAYQSGCKNVLGLRWYALALLALKDFDRAKEVLDEWLKIEPKNTEAKSYRDAASQPDQFVSKLRRTQEQNLKALGANAMFVPRKPAVSIDTAVQEMIQSSASLGNGITGFKPQKAVSLQPVD
ncbi:hypothetical protein FACS189454_03930 [Planctomycetales bacterium]|nr:hypothetical protein FACS189454_03930 [Planctomycetales bacterium]